MKHDRQGRLILVADSHGPEENELRAVIQNDGFTISSCGYSAEESLGQREWTCDLQWRTTPADAKIPIFVGRLRGRQGIVRVSWTPQGR